MTGDRVGELGGEILAAMVRSFLEPEGATDQLAALAERALPVFEAAGDDVGSYIGNCALGLVADMRGRYDAGLEAYERAATHAQRAGLGQELLSSRAASRLFGTTPVSELLAWLDVHEPHAELSVTRSLALAMLGRFKEARTILAEKRARLAESGARMDLAGVTAIASVDIELLAGDPAAAAELGTEGCSQLEDLGERSLLSTGGRRTRTGALRARPARRGRHLGYARGGARLERRRDHADALAASPSEGSRTPWRAWES